MKMPSFTVRFHTALSKFYLKRSLHTFLHSSRSHIPTPYGVVSRPDHPVAPANPTFSAADGVATKDLHIDDPLTSLAVRIFLPDCAIIPSDSLHDPTGAAYGGYLPDATGRNCRKLPVILHFHGGGWVSGGADTVGNDVFCRRVAKSCEAVVVSVGYRLAPESRYPAAFVDGIKALKWLAKQANLASCGAAAPSFGKLGIVDGFGGLMAEPWLAAHADPSRCVVIGVSCGANIGNYVSQYSVKAGKLVDPIRIVAQVLMYPFAYEPALPTKLVVTSSSSATPTHSSSSSYYIINSYLYDESMASLAWKLFLPPPPEAAESGCGILLRLLNDNNHGVAVELGSGRHEEVALKCMPPTLTVVADHDWMSGSAIAYSKELRKVNVDAPVLEYKDTVHEFATLEPLINTPQARACAEDIAIWIKKYISLRGHEMSY